MKAGRSLQDIAAELERQQNTRKDYIASQGVIDAVIVDDDVRLDLKGTQSDPLPILPHAHRQFADHLGIPQKYYDRMKAEHPDLLATNINAWLKDAPDEKRMVRTLDGKTRGFLSAKFRPLDNFDLASVSLPVLQSKGAQVLSAELTETRFYIKAILPSLSDPEFVEAFNSGEYINGRDQMAVSRLVASVVISNSEVGAGTLRVEPSIFTTRCTNLAIIVAAAMKKYHVVRSFANEEENAYEVFADATRIADDKAFWLKVKDVTVAAFREETFKAGIAQIRTAQGMKIVSAELPKVVELAVKRLALPDGITGNVLTHLAKGGDLSQWGLSAAFTATANTADDYELATALERAGGQVLALPAANWDAIAKAA